MHFDIAIIGGGPGGYTAAEKAAKAGLQVVLFEQEDLGGTCLNRGCMPTKALLHSAETFAALAHAQDLGVHTQGASYDFAAMHQRKAQVVETLRQGVEKLMKANKITVVHGQACIQKAGVVTCNDETYEVQDILIATGSKVAYPPIPGIDLPGVYNSRDMLQGNGQDFASLVIIGGGVVGVEFASIYRCLGCQVTLLEAADHILPFGFHLLEQRVDRQRRRRLHPRCNFGNRFQCHCSALPFVLYDVIICFPIAFCKSALVKLQNISNKNNTGIHDSGVDFSQRAVFVPREYHKRTSAADRYGKFCSRRCLVRNCDHPRPGYRRVPQRILCIFD